MADPEKAMEVENDHEDVEDEEVDGDNSKQVSELLKNPALMEALQGKLGQMVGMNSGYIAVIILQHLKFLFFFFPFSKLFYDECHCGSDTSYRKSTMYSTFISDYYILFWPFFLIFFMTQAFV